MTTQKLILGTNCTISLKKGTTVLVGDTLSAKMSDCLAESKLIPDIDCKVCSTLAEAIKFRESDKETPLIANLNPGEFYGDNPDFDDAYALDTDNTGKVVLGQRGRFLVRLDLG